MAQTPQPLTTAQAGRLQQAYALMQAGRAEEAAAGVRAVLFESPHAVDALHLLALCNRAAGDFAGAEAAFRSALALAPDHAPIRCNFASLLARSGRRAEAHEQYLHALQRTPSFAEGWMNYGLSLLEAGEAAAATEALEKASGLAPSSSPVWQALGSARRALRDYPGAEAALRRAVEIAPANGAAWASLGVLRRLEGDPADSLACYEQARKAGFAGPELPDARASALLDLGDVEAAYREVRALTTSRPDYVAGQVMLAHLLWEHGGALAPGEDAIVTLRSAVASQPDNAALWFAYIQFLLEARRGEDAVRELRQVRAEADHPMLAALEANALSITGEKSAASALFAEAYQSMRGNPGFLRAYARHRLKTGSPDAAASLVEEVLSISPDDQEALAYLATAWRLMDDAREYWLCDYEKLIAPVAVEPPAAFSTRDDFIRALIATLEPMHKARREPVNQSLRGGSQTSGSLFGRPDPVIRATRDAIARAVERHVATLPDDDAHPFLRRKAERIRFVGSWSVKLWSEGAHVNHIHQEGWMSSAFYVMLPPSVGRDDSDRSGWIQFGQPPLDLGLGLKPRRYIKPEIGRIALFPSYMWHGTVPFTDQEPRMTMAFDMTPAGV